MKFGERFSEYLHGEDEHFLDKCTNVEYKRLKKVLKKCRVGYLHDGTTSESEGRLSSSQTTENEDLICEETAKSISKSPDPSNRTCSPKTCPVCDKIFFYELTKEVSAIVGCFSSRARRLLHLHLASGFQRYLWRIKHFFADDHEAMIREGRHLVSYVAMNAIAIRKILKKYDKPTEGELTGPPAQHFLGCLPLSYHRKIISKIWRYIARSRAGTSGRSYRRST